MIILQILYTESALQQCCWSLSLLRISNNFIVSPKWWLRVFNFLTSPKWHPKSCSSGGTFYMPEIVLLNVQWHCCYSCCRDLEHDGEREGGSPLRLNRWQQCQNAWAANWPYWNRFSFLASRIFWINSFSSINQGIFQIILADCRGSTRYWYRKPRLLKLRLRWLLVTITTFPYSCCRARSNQICFTIKKQSGSGLWGRSVWSQIVVERQNQYGHALST